jgi:hypothetical protein
MLHMFMVNVFCHLPFALPSLRWWWLLTVYFSWEYLREKYHCTIDLLFDWFGISCMTTDKYLFLFAKELSKPVKQEADGTVILPPLVFPDLSSVSMIQAGNSKIALNKLTTKHLKHTGIS